MSLQHAAKHLEKHGRNGDTMLVHMSKGEVKSLNDLAMAHGGYLTINPHTGLPEAGFLQRMLPMAIGAGLMMVPGMQPMTAAALVGGGYAASTGSLKKGLMAGLGAYGGAGMAGSFGAAGAPTVAPDLASAAITTPAAAVTPAALPAEVVASDAAAAAPAATTLPAVPVSATPLPPAISNTPFTTAPTITPTITPAPAPVVEAPVVEAPAPAPVAEAPVETSQFAHGAGGDEINAKFGAQTPSMDFNNMTASQRLEAMKSGTSFDNLGKFANENRYTAYGMGASALTPWDEDPKEKEKPDSDPGQQYTYEANATNPTPAYDSSGREQKYFDQRYVKRAAGGMMATGGISDAHYNLGGYSDGGRLLRGPGDGVSDSIPAVIGKKQPARLADGEFVVPARIVSEIGNGSTEAGARKLYAMMDRIQKARGKTVGKGKVAKNTRADKYLPA